MVSEFLLPSLRKTCTSPRNFLIAYSGGLDSHVLLHLMAQIRLDHPKIRLTAIHVNHQLSPHADNWMKHCQKICHELNIPLLTKTIAVKKTPQKSLEAEARNLRYQAFSAELTADTYLLTAHNQNDQAETLLLQLLRGTGLKGLAAMPTVIEFANSFLLRPLLNFSRAELQEYAEKNKLQWIEDESNLNINFDRNFIRHELMPLMQKRWPSAQETLSRTARHCGEAAALLSEFADADLKRIEGSHRAPSVSEWVVFKNKAKAPMVLCLREHDKQKLNIHALLNFSLARQRNILREWLYQLAFPTPSEIKILQIQNEIITARADAKPLLKWEGTEIRRYQNYLYALKPLPVIDSHWEKNWNLKTPLALPNNLGVLVAEKKRGAGYLKLSVNTQITVRFRREGERCQPAGRVGSHPLKKLMQEWQIPPWQRDRIPLLYANETLIAVVGYCVCEGYNTKATYYGLSVRIQVSDLPNTGMPT